MSKGVAIVGVAESDLGITGASVLGLQGQAISRAMHDAGLEIKDIDGIATSGVSRFLATQVADYLGLQPRWSDSTFAGGSAYEMYVARAVQAIETGQASTIVISFASNQRSARSRLLSGVIEPQMPEAQFEAPYGPLYPISYYAMAAQKYLAEYSLGREHLAQVAILAREWALLNPKAFRFDAGPLSLEKVMEADLISSPLSTSDCCLVTDGGGAVVVTSLERARDLRRPPIQVLGYGESTTNTSMSQVSLLPTGALASGKAAFDRSGLSPIDVDVLEIYDSFTITVLLSLEDLGFCRPGEAAALVASERVRLGGDLPLNTSGGGLSYCHPGQLGVLLLVEAVRQLRGEAGARQVKDPEIALAHGTGGILSTHATVLLGVDR